MNYNDTYRFIIDNYIKFYNEYFKSKQKKYYVENTKNDSLITFFKRNNKVCFNFTILKNDIFEFCIKNVADILSNTEVIIVNNNILDLVDFDIYNWNGDIIIKDE